jgi:hypothetical protein
MGVGVMELAVMIPLVLLSIVVPVLVLVLQVMIYRRLNQIERRLQS